MGKAKVKIQITIQSSFCQYINKTEPTRISKNNVPILKSIVLPSLGIFLQGFLFQSGAGGKSRGGGWRGESVRRCKA